MKTRSVIPGARKPPDIARLKQLVDARRLGKPILVSGRVKWYRPPEYYRDSRWRGVPALDGGGALMNQGVHTVDLLLWLMGDVTRVNAKAITALHDIEEKILVVATLEYANGAIGTLEATPLVYPGYRRRIELTARKERSSWRTIKSSLRICATPVRTSVFSPNQSKKGERPCSNSPVVSDVSGHRKVLEDFLRAIETNGKPMCDGYEGRRQRRACAGNLRVVANRRSCNYLRVMSDECARA